MTAQPTKTAVRDAIDRIIETIRSHYATELSSIKTHSNLPLPAPDDEDIYWTYDRPREAIKEKNVAFFVLTESPRQLEETGSGGAGVFHEKRTLQIAGVTIFKMHPYEDITRHGKALTSEEVMALRAHDYKGAMEQAIREHAMDGSSIHDLTLRDDASFTQYIDQEDRQSGLVGVAANKFEIEQYTQAPSPV